MTSKAALGLDAFHKLILNFAVQGWQVGGVVASSAIAYAIAKVVQQIFIEPLLSHLRELPGPETVDSFFWGNNPTVFTTSDLAAQEEWFEKYGSTFQYRGLFMRRQLCTKDPRAIAYILNNAYAFPKPETLRRSFLLLFGYGLLFVEGNDHRRQRKVMNPAFSNARVRDLVPIFFEKGHKLKEVWKDLLKTGSGKQDIDVMIWLNRVTLDIIGKAGFDWDFNSLTQGETDELISAFMTVFSPTQSVPILPIIQELFPPLRIFKTQRTRDMVNAKAIMKRIGTKLVAEKKAAILADAKQAGGISRKTLVDHDILTTMLKANMASDVKESERLSDQEVMDQIATLMIAGHETTASSLTWLLWELSKPHNHHIQDRLRAELQTLSSETPTMDELAALPYLDAVVRENLRIHAVVEATSRAAGEDTAIPLSKPLTDKKGVAQNEIKLKAGEFIFLPLVSLNREEAIWGKDARIFNPDRWLSGNGHSAELPGVFSGILTFLGGPRACIGYRMALAETKVLIHVLLTNFAFNLPEKKVDIIKKSFLVTRPAMKGEDGKYKYTMPLNVSVLNQDT